MAGLAADVAAFIPPNTLPMISPIAARRSPALLKVSVSSPVSFFSLVVSCQPLVTTSTQSKKRRISGSAATSSSEKVPTRFSMILPNLPMT